MSDKKRKRDSEREREGTIYSVAQLDTPHIDRNDQHKPITQLDD